MENNDSSLTFLNACATITMYSGASRDIIEARKKEILAAIETILRTDSRDVEDYLAEHVIQVKADLWKGAGSEYAYFNSGPRPQV